MTEISPIVPLNIKMLSNFELQNKLQKEKKAW